jgi:hypothetical protein
MIHDLFPPGKTLGSWITNGKPTDGLINLKRRLNLEGQVAKDKTKTHIRTAAKLLLHPNCHQSK